MIPLAARTEVDWVALSVLIVLFVVATVLGFMASRFKRGDTLESLDEWGLGGRKFGTWVTWFLLGGDLYTAYTFVAVPAAMFAMRPRPGTTSRTRANRGWRRARARSIRPTNRRPRACLQSQWPATRRPARTLASLSSLAVALPQLRSSASPSHAEDNARDGQT